MLLFRRFFIFVLPLGSGGCTSIRAHDCSWRHMSECLGPIVRMLARRRGAWALSGRLRHCKEPV